jgi:CheY-like chemotaxis protein
VPAPLPPLAPGEGGAERMLVCDDDPLVLRSLVQMLEAGGYRIRAVEGGEAALEALDQEPFDIVVTDVIMGRINGPEVARRARELHPGLPVVFVSGYTKDVLAATLDGPLVVKPFGRAELLDAVRRALLARPKQAT